MKKIFTLSIFLFFCLLSSFGQVINREYFPENNEIDKQYEIDIQKWITNYEWQEIIGKYKDLWKNQMYLEMERLISKIPESESVIRENQKKWEEAVERDYTLVFDNVNMNLVGREVYIGEFGGNRISLYRERAKYFLCLYYTITDQTSDGIFYTDIHETELAK